MLFNEASTPVTTTVTLPVSGSFARLRLMEEGAYRDVAACGRADLTLLAGESEIWVFGDEDTVAALPAVPALIEGVVLKPTYTVELAETDDLTAYTPYKVTDELFNVTSARELPHFSGKMRYTFTVRAEEARAGTVLDLGRVGQTARVWVNGRDAGIRITAPYRYSVENLLVDGENTITVEVANTLVGKERDGFSYHMAIGPSGLLGPVRLMQKA